MGSFHHGYPCLQREWAVGPKFALVRGNGCLSKILEEVVPIQKAQPWVISETIGMTKDVTTMFAAVRFN